MNVSSNLSSIQSNQSFLNTTAKSIENQSGDLSKNITNLIVAEDVNSVNVTALKTQDEMLGSLLDIKA
jgi:flagellar hook protein FlgE